MDYAIDWAESALEDLKDLVRYIAADNPVAAERFGDHQTSRSARHFSPDGKDRSGIG